MEAFAAVASGAGLVSLAMQILQSSQKLKGLCNASRDAPRTIEDLCFELETLSLQLRQLERHRHLDCLDTTEVLGRCIAVCERRTTRVRDLVDAMARYMRRSSTFGRVYTAFSEPEMKKLLVELEQAKSSLSLAYISYCQYGLSPKGRVRPTDIKYRSWNVRDSGAQMLAMQQHRNMLALQQLQLDDIQQNVSRGNSLLTSRLAGISKSDNDVHCTRVQKNHRARQRRMYLRLPQWLAERTWTIAAYQSQGSWTVEIQPEVWRPFETPALDFIRTGDIVNVRRALTTGELSIWDSTWHPWESLCPSATLLELAVYHGQVELCDYLLDSVEHFRKDDHLLRAAKSLRCTFSDDPTRAEILELLAGKYDMDVYIWGSDDDTSHVLKSEFYDLSKVIMSHQPLSVERVPSQHRFDIAMKLRGRPPADFLATVGLEIDDSLIAMTDQCGATALHWAAKHWSIGHRRKWPPSRLGLYGNFIVSLVQAGLPVSAIDRNCHSSFMCLLDHDHTSDGWPYGTWRMPNSVCPTQVINSWCTLLGQAGVPMPRYLATENELLSRSGPEHQIHEYWRGRTMELKSVTVSDQMTFAMRVHTVDHYERWEVQPPPGSYTNITPELRILPWAPASEGGFEQFWQLVERVTLKSSEHFVLSPDSIEDAEFSLGDILFGATQDDHTTLAAICQREQWRIDRGRNGIRDRRRSSSAPPAAKTFVQYRIRICHPHPPNSRPLYVHKCPRDSHWGFCSGSEEHEYGTWAICMSGCGGRPDHSADIVAAFVPQEKSLKTSRERWLADNFPERYGSDGDLRSRLYRE